MFTETCKFSERCTLQSRPGVKRLEQIGTYLIIANKARFYEGTSHRFAVVNESGKWVDSVHGSHRAAVKHAQRLVKNRM